MGHFFISYSRRDFYFAESLFYALRCQGIDAWMDVWNIAPGDNWDDAFTNAVQSCEGLILIATRDSLHSAYVRDEICRAHQADKPIYLIVRGGFAKRDLHISHEFPVGTPNSISLSENVRAVVDVRADFAKGLKRLIDAITHNAQYRDNLPGRFSVKMETILYIPPLVVLLALFMAVTDFWKFGVDGGYLYFDQLDQFLAYGRDIVHGAIGETLLLVPTIVGGIVTVGALMNVTIIGFNFSRRKRLGSNHFDLLLVSAVLTGLVSLSTDVAAVALEGIFLASNSVHDFLKPGESAPSPDLSLSLLLVAHGLAFILLVILAVAFVRARSKAEGGCGALLRWLPTGYATDQMRRKGNDPWIRNLPGITMSSGPAYRSYAIIASPEDLSTAQDIKSMLQEKGYLVTDDPAEAECDLYILSPFSDDSPLKHAKGVMHSKPVIYVISRSIKPPKDASIAIQWIDYRRPYNDQFWRQWQKEFSQLKSKNPVFPYVPEALADTIIPTKYGCGIWLLMIGVATGSVLLISGMEYLVLLNRALQSLFLPLSIIILLGAMGLGYYVVAQVVRGVISRGRARLALTTAGMLTVIAAIAFQSSLLILGSLGVLLVNLFLAKITWSTLRAWLPTTPRKPRRTSLLQPISTYKALTSRAYFQIMILGFLGLHALITNSWIVPQIPQEPASRPYAVAVPGPYYLAAPGQWTQDSYAQAFGYRFDYHPNTLEVSQYQVTGHPTWLKFFGVNSYPMRFAPHFDSTIHVHFTSNDVRTDLGFVVNDFLKEQPSDLVGPQIRLSASGLWTVYESNGNHYSGQVDQGNLSLDYTLEMEVNGALCTYRINGKEVTTIADAALSSVKDVMLSIASLAPGGATYNLSNFTYTPMPGPGLSRDEASKLVAAGDTAPYTTVAPGWNCNPDDGRWNARYEPAQQNANVICSPAGTQLNASGNSGAALYFDDHRFGELPQAFDYSFDATFQGTGTQCIELQTFAMVTPTGIAYAYVFLLCSNGNWEIKHVGFHTADFSIFFMQQLQSGHIAVNKTLPIFVEYRSTVQRFYMGKQLVASYEAEDLQPTILFTNDQGPVLYSNFSYNPATQ